MKTLYDRNPRAIEALKAKGYPALARMATLFEKAGDIDRELNLNHNAHNWMNGRSKPSRASEILAARWLKDNPDRCTSKQERMALDVEPPAPASAPAPGPVIKAHPEPEQTANVMIVTGPPDALAKAQRLLSVIGCSVEAV